MAIEIVSSSMKCLPVSASAWKFAGHRCAGSMEGKKGDRGGRLWMNPSLLRSPKNETPPTLWLFNIAMEDGPFIEYVSCFSYQPHGDFP